MTYAIVTGVAVSGMYILLALGFTFLLRIADIVNLAYGAMVVGGMYLTIWMVNDLGLPFLPAIPLVVALGLLPSWVVYELFLHHARREGHRPQVVYTILVLSIAEIVYQMLFGTDPVRLDVPGQSWEILGVAVRRETVIGFCVALTVCIVLFVCFRHTSIGKSIEAAGKYPEGARVIGLPTGHLYRIVFLVGSGMAFLAGALVVPSAPATPFLGIDFLIVPVVIALASRLSFVGTVFASLLYGVGYQILLQLVDDPATATILIYAVLIGVIALVAPVGRILSHLRMPRPVWHVLEGTGK